MTAPLYVMLAVVLLVLAAMGVILVLRPARVQVQAKLGWFFSFGLHIDRDLPQLPPAGAGLVPRQEQGGRQPGRHRAGT